MTTTPDNPADLDELLGVDLTNPSHALARTLAEADEGLRKGLVAARVRAGLTHEDVAARTGLSVRVVDGLESGVVDPPLSVMRRWAHAVGVVVTHHVE